MKKGTILCLLMLLTVLATAQEVDKTLENRNMRQQLFVIDYMKANKPAASFSSTDEIDEYFAQLSGAWVKEVRGEDPLMAQFNPYVHIQTLAMLVGSDTPEWAECHIYSKYMVPSFLADFERYSNDITPENAYLVRRPDFDWMTGSLALRSKLSLQDWERFKSALDKIPSLMERYLESGAYSDENVKLQLQHAKRYAERINPYLGIQDSLYQSNRDAAFAALAAALTQDYDINYLILLSRQLWQSYKAAGETNKALASLDLLARSLTSADLPRDTLRSWYEEVDPERGPERFNLMTSGSDLPPLVPSGRQADLSGRYLDLLTNELFDLSELKGKTVLIDFWATWCGPCLAEIPKLKELVAKHGESLMLVGISGDAVTKGGKDQAGVRECMEEHGINYMVLYDDPQQSLTKRFGVVEWPTMFLINEKGEFMKHPNSKGRVAVSRKDVEAYLDSLRRLGRTNPPV